MTQQHTERINLMGNSGADFPADIVLLNGAWLMFLYRSSCLGERWPEAIGTGKAAYLLWEMNICTSVPGPCVVPMGTLEVMGVWRLEGAELCREGGSVQTVKEMHIKSFGILVGLCCKQGLIRAWQTVFLRVGGTSCGEKGQNSVISKRVGKT